MTDSRRARSRVSRRRCRHRHAIVRRRSGLGGDRVAGRVATDTDDRRDPRRGRGPPAPGRRAGRRDRPRLRRPRPGAGRRAQGRGDLHGRPDARARAPVRDRLHGGLELRLGDRLLGRRPDPQGPRRLDRRPRRADRRGHRRLGPDAALPAAEPAGARARARSRSARCSPSPSAAGSTCRSATSGSRSRTASRSATASTTPSATATFATSLRWRSKDRSQPPAFMRDERLVCAADPSPGTLISIFPRAGLRFTMRRFFRSAAFPILIVIVLAFFAQRLISPATQEETPTYTEFIAAGRGSPDLDQESVTIKQKTTRSRHRGRRRPSTRPATRPTREPSWSTRSSARTSRRRSRAPAARASSRSSPTSCPSSSSSASGSS